MRRAPRQRTVGRVGQSLDSAQRQTGSALPNGTVTFLLTDVQDSTRAWLRDPDAMSVALARHDALIERLVAEHGGHVVRPRGEGDSRFAVFVRPSDALAGACAVQLAFAEERWPLAEPLRVRMAIHTGETQLRLGDYYGPAINRCARLRGVAHGGQVIVSAVTADLVREALSPGLGLRDLGLHQLKDLDRAERVWQLLHPRLPPDFPPLGSVPATLHNLPNQLNSFVGRDQAVAELDGLLDTARLVTLIGSGGIGKTRLALAVAASLLDAVDFPDGVWLADLAALSDDGLLVEVVAASVGVHEEPGRPLRETLLQVLRSRSLLLLLDNCEHVLDACAALADELLSHCSKLRILATSREPLRIASERVWRVPLLPVPDPGDTLTLDELTNCPSVCLFVERAQAVEPSFALSAQNSIAVAAICARLDGLPLALELAAARSRVLAPDQILARLDDAFKLLIGGSRSAPTRQQTLRATLDWSLHLLETEGQRRFEALAVFAGSFDLDAVEAVWTVENPPPQLVRDSLEVLTELVDRSLVMLQPRAGAMRYRLLEPVRQYAQQRLIARGEWEAHRARHAEYFLNLVERGEQGLQGSEQTTWVTRLHLEHDNIRVALRRALDAHEVATALRIAAALPHFWRHAGFRNEGRQWIEQSLDQGGEAPPQVRAKALHAAAELAVAQGDFRGARVRFEAALEVWRGLGNQAGVAAALPQYGRVLARTATSPQAHHEAVSALEQAVALNRELGRQFWTGWALLFLGNTAWEHAELQSAAAALGEAEEIFRRLGESHAHAHALFMVGAVLRDQGHLDRAQPLIEDSLASSRAIKCESGAAESLYHLALLNRVRGWTQQAEKEGVESLDLQHRLRNLGELAVCTELLGGLAIDQGQPQRTVRLYAAASAMRETIGVPMPARQWPARELELDAARRALGAKQYRSEWAAGESLTVDQLVEYATAPSAVATAAPKAAAADPLSQREREVIALVARGYTNRQIAETLIISERTADGHVARILAKLALATRSQAAVWAVEHAVKEP